MSDIFFNHLGQCVTDLGRSRAFYEQVLGFTFWREIAPPDEATAKLLGLHGALGMRACYLRLDGLVLELLEFGASEHQRAPLRRAMDEPGLTHLSFSCDIDLVLTRVEPAGGSIEHDTNIGNATFIRDPDGQLIELLPLGYADYVRSHP